jgi:hypothetical protein
VPRTCDVQGTSASDSLCRFILSILLILSEREALRPLSDLSLTRFIALSPYRPIALCERPNRRTITPDHRRAPRWEGLAAAPPRGARNALSPMNAHLMRI